MVPSEEMCRSIAPKAGLPLDFVVKEFYLFNLMEGIVGGGFSKDLVFKGGTALNSVYLSGLRFSEDLDFDLAKEIDDVKGYLGMVIGGAAGFAGTEMRRVRNTYMIDFVYDSPLGRRDKVRLDVRVGVQHLSAEKPRRMAMRSVVTGQVVGNVLVYGFEDLLARKMSALAERGEGKDLFDVSNAIGRADRRKLLGAIGYMLKDLSKEADITGFIGRVLDRLENMDYNKAMKLTNPYIPMANRPASWKLLGADLAERMLRLMESDTGV